MLAVLVAGAGARAGDWPQLAHDAARSGATADEVRPPFARKWYRLFADEGLQAGVQPVVAGGRVYIGTLRGRLHAMDAETGKDVWAHDAGAPILHAAAAAGGKIFFGTAPGGLCAVDAADGAKAWTLPIEHGVWAAPLVHEGLVIVGGRDGKLYAADAANGAVRWSAATGGPLLNSPALDAKAGRVYVGSEDMCVYAFDLKSGKRVWRSPKLPGVSLRGYHPVVAPDGSVMVTVTPGGGGDAMQQVLLDMTREVFGEFSSWRIKDPAEKRRIKAANFDLMNKPETYARQMAYLRKRLTDEPSLQTFFVLDGATGKPKFVAPVVYAESMNGPASPPLVTADGKVLVKYSVLSRSRYEHYSPFLNVGYLDTATGEIAPAMDEARTYGWHGSLLLVHDEQSQLMAAGKLLINTHQDNVNAIDLSTREGYEQPFAHGVHEVKPGVAAAVWAHVLHEKELPHGWEWLPRGTAVYGGGSAIDTPVVVAGDSFYFLPTHEINAGVALVAYRTDKGGRAAQKVEPEQLLKEKLTYEDWPRIIDMKWDWDTIDTARLSGTLEGLPAKPPGTRQNVSMRDATMKSAVTDAELDALILPPAPRPVAAAPPDVRARLAAAVEELIGTRWRPLLFPAGKAPAEAYRLFTEPTETLYTLALAYPHLPADLQARVRAHVAKLSEKGGPLDGPVGARSYDANAGEVRSAYDEPSAALVRIGAPVMRSDAGRIYPLYLWAANTGDWDRLKRDWPALRALAEREPEKGEADAGNARLGGLMAACRIAKQFDDAAALAALLPAARAAWRARLQHEFAYTEGGLITAVGNRSLLGRWHHLSPDVAAVLAARAKAVHRRLMDVYVDHHRPAWYVAWNVELLWRNETPFSFPDMSGDIFAARAMILGEPAGRLARFVDVPWCKGDELYVQKLALLAGAGRE